MTTPLDIDRIVREVLAALGEAAPSGEGTVRIESAQPKAPAAPTVRQKLPAAEGAKSAFTKAELALTTRLVTLSEVSGRLAGVRRLIVGPGTVITPAVKEEIARRNIQVIVNAAAKEASDSALKLVLVAARTKIDPQPYAAALRGENVEVELHSAKCLIEATDRVAGEVKKSETLALMLTPYEAESLCLANRQPGVRAIAGRDAAQVAADATAVGANVLIVNPKRVGAYAIRQMLGEFTRGGVRPCPDVLKPRLI